MKIIFASTNKGKIKEIKSIFNEDKFKVFSMEEIGIDLEIEETGETYEENALIKARTIAELDIIQEMEAIVIADDSGLEIEHFNGWPGIHSARFIGENSTNKERMKAVLERMKDVKNRKARLISTVAVVFPEGNEEVTSGVLNGEITEKIKGTNHFDFSSIFRPDDEDCTLSEITLEEKNEISHRGKSLKNIKNIINYECLDGFEFQKIYDRSIREVIQNNTPHTCKMSDNYKNKIATKEDIWEVIKELEEDEYKMYEDDISNFLSVVHTAEHRWSYKDELDKKLAFWMFDNFGLVDPETNESEIPEHVEFWISSEIESYSFFEDVQTYIDLVLKTCKE